MPLNRKDQIANIEWHCRLDGGAEPAPLPADTALADLAGLDQFSRAALAKVGLTTAGDVRARMLSDATLAGLPGIGEARHQRVLAVIRAEEARRGSDPNVQALRSAIPEAGRAARRLHTAVHSRLGKGIVELIDYRDDDGCLKVVQDAQGSEWLRLRWRVGGDVQANLVLGDIHRGRRGAADKRFVLIPSGQDRKVLVGVE